MASNFSSDQIAQGQEGKRHVFISYQWDSQPMIKKIVSSLKKEGFRVWVDFVNMSGSILEAMAKAVEDAAVVIVCLSQKYKDSRNCKTEVEYTFRKGKDIIPLQLQSDYWPDGGLGAFVGNRLMLDFTNDDKYSESVKKLISELGERGKTTEYKEKNVIELPEKMKIEITDRMKRLLNVSDFLCTERVSDMEFLYNTWRDVTDSQKKEVGDLLATLGVTKLFIKIWKTYFAVDFLKDVNSLMYTLMHGILWVLCNSMESSTELCFQAFESNLHQVVLDYLKTDYLDLSKAVDPHCDVVVFGLMGVLYNMLQKVSQLSQSLREQEAFEGLQRFRRSPSNKIACMALIVQLYIITERESKFVNANDSNFTFLKDVLETALIPNNSGRRAYGFSPFEVISALNRLVVNDDNKTRIVNVGLLPFYVMLLKPQCSEEEQEAAAEGLWTLAFKCTDEIENERGCVPALKKLTTVNSERLKRLTEGVLWTLEESKRKKYISRAGQEGQRHIFISYQWDSLPIIEKLARSLQKKGFRVWVDFGNMYGSKLEAMAEAMEEAAVVIVCLSQKYKEAPNCRTEAEYAIQLRKEIVPIGLPSHYRPGGWLEALVGSKLVHDFTGDGMFSESIENLIGELGVRGKETEYKGEEGQRHVYISYQWDSQEMIKKLVSSFKKGGFLVWVDYENMSELDAMAAAVEEAAVVIVCLSEKYKESRNCRTEAEYAFQLRKEIVPIRLQSHYRPGGWLETLVGSNLVHDFTSDEMFSKSIENLIGELGVRVKETEYKVFRREFFIVSEMHREVLDISDADPSPGTLVAAVAWSRESPPAKNQLWYFDSSGFIHSALNDLVPESRGGSMVKMAHLRGDGFQQWTVDGNKIVSRAGECLDVKKNGTVISCEYHKTSNQHWRLEYV